MCFLWLKNFLSLKSGEMNQNRKTCRHYLRWHIIKYSTIYVYSFRQIGLSCTNVAYIPIISYNPKFRASCCVACFVLCCVCVVVCTCCFVMVPINLTLSILFATFVSTLTSLKFMWHETQCTWYAQYISFKGMIIVFVFFSVLHVDLHFVWM